LKTDLYPFNIINDFKSGKLDKSIVIEKLSSFLLKTDDHKKKIVVIDFLLRLPRNLGDKEDELKLTELFKSVIQNERYVYVIQHIKNSIEHLSKTFQKSVLEEILKKYVLFYDVVPEEVQFIMDLDYLDPSDPAFGKPIQFVSRYKNNVCFPTIKDIRSNFRFSVAIKHNHIIGIIIKKQIKRIPVSIGALKKLKFMRIYSFEGINFPKSFELLTQLRDFRIYSNFPIEIPINLKKRAQNFFIQKYLEYEVHPDDALILANLDIIGWPLGNLEKVEYFREDPEWYNQGDVDVSDYRLNGDGRVTEIYIKPWENNSPMPFFPEEFCFLEKLEVLDLKFFELEYIPESIMNLKSLKHFNISNFGDKTVKISQKVKKFLDSLQYLRIDSKLEIIS
jgi:hypothetical protein